MANGSNAASPRTRIATPEIQAVFVEGTVRVRGTFWTTIGWSANKIRQAIANRLFIVGSALGIGSTR